MDLFDLFFRTGPAIQVLFKLGYMPKDEEFYEMTCQQYQHYFDVYGHTDEKIYLLLPEDQKKYTELASGDAFCMKESEKDSLKDAEKIIEEYCRKSDKQFLTFQDKLRYAATCLPDVFSKDTPFAKG